ncbi:MAG: hypothetical protein LBT33_08850 [Spirochaetia bacterium]|nr:hypothetical protein [Spirochaetia bacterium]
MVAKNGLPPMQPGLAIIGIDLYAPHAALNCIPELAPRFFIFFAGTAALCQKPPGPREGLQRKSFFAAGRQKRLERKARFFLLRKKNAPNIFSSHSSFLIPNSYYLLLRP